METFKYEYKSRDGGKRWENHLGVLFDDGTAVVYSDCDKPDWVTTYRIRGRGRDAVESYFSDAAGKLSWNVDDRKLIKRFQLRRSQDVTGVSGEGVVAQGVQFGVDGSAVIRWCVEGMANSTVLWDSVTEAMEIHGHAGMTVVEWLD